MENNKKNTLLLTVIAIATLLVAVVGATFAYFSAQVQTDESEQVQVQTHTNNTLTYNIDKALSVNANDTNFAENMGDRSDTATGTATYKAGAEQSTACYTADLTINSNNFTYSTAPTNTPELTLTVTKNSTNVITDMDITTRTTDVHFPTTLNGSTYKNEITAAAQGTQVDTWTVTVTFENLDTDQSDPTNANNNAEKTFTGALVFTTVDCSTGNPVSGS